MRIITAIAFAITLLLTCAQSQAIRVRIALELGTVISDATIENVQGSSVTVSSDGTLRVYEIQRIREVRVPKGGLVLKSAEWGGFIGATFYLVLGAVTFVPEERTFINYLMSSMGGGVVGFAIGTLVGLVRQLVASDQVYDFYALEPSQKAAILQSLLDRTSKTE